MHLQERIVSAILGAIFGALFGLVSALLSRNRSYAFTHWENMVIGSAIVFAVLGFVFKSAAGTIIGSLFDGVVSRAVQNGTGDFVSGLAFWIKALIVTAVAAAVYWYIKA
jgi:hypothetical protein